MRLVVLVLTLCVLRSISASSNGNAVRLNDKPAIKEQIQAMITTNLDKQGPSNCASGCYRCVSYDRCVQCYSGYLLSNGYCYVQTNSSSGGVSWLFIICCLACCGGCFYFAAQQAQAHHNHHHHEAEPEYHQPPACPLEDNHGREMREMLDHHGQPIMRTPVIHGYDYDQQCNINPPAFHHGGHAYTPPPPLPGNPYGNQMNAGIYNPQAPYGNPGYGNIYPHQQNPREINSSNQVDFPLPPGFERPPPVYPRTPNPAGNTTSKLDKSKGIDYPSMVEESKVISKDGKGGESDPKKDSPNKAAESNLKVDNSKLEKESSKDKQEAKNDKSRPE